MEKIKFLNPKMYNDKDLPLSIVFERIRQKQPLQIKDLIVGEFTPIRPNVNVEIPGPSREFIFAPAAILPTAGSEPTDKPQSADVDPTQVPNLVAPPDSSDSIGENLVTSPQVRIQQGIQKEGSSFPAVTTIPTISAQLTPKRGRGRPSKRGNVRVLKTSNLKRRTSTTANNKLGKRRNSTKVGRELARLELAAPKCQLGSRHILRDAGDMRIRITRGLANSTMRGSKSNNKK